MRIGGVVLLKGEESYTHAKLPKSIVKRDTHALMMVNVFMVAV
jgi:hypothetical protein